MSVQTILAAIPLLGFFFAGIGGAVAVVEGGSDVGGAGVGGGGGVSGGEDFASDIDVASAADS